MTLPPVTSSSAGGRRSAVAAHPVISAVIAILIFAAIFFALYVPLYASATPKVGDFPFFYFYLLVYFGTIAAYKVATPTTSHWAGSVDTVFGHSVYIGLSAFIVNLAVSVILTLVFRAVRIPAGTDETLPHDYKAETARIPAAVPAGVGAGSGGDLPTAS